MGVSGDYVDVDSVFEYSIYLHPPDSPVGYEPTTEPTMSLGKTMLPVRKDSVASQECVEEHPSDEETEGVGAEVATDHEVAGAERTRAPLLYIRGERWSPGVYRSLRLLGHPLTVPWKKAFIPLLTF
jgi:hypothetical protein